MDKTEKTYGKLNKFGELTMSPEIINDGINLIINPTVEQLLEYGYKEISYADKPEYDIKTECLELRYKDMEDCILAYYEIIPNIVEDNREVILE